MQNLKVWPPLCSQDCVTINLIATTCDVTMRQFLLKQYTKSINVVFFTYEVKEAMESFLNLLEDYLLPPFFFDWCADLWSVCWTYSYGPDYIYAVVPKGSPLIWQYTLHIVRVQVTNWKDSGRNSGNH